MNKPRTIEEFAALLKPGKRLLSMDEMNKQVEEALASREKSKPHSKSKPKSKK